MVTTVSQAPANAALQDQAHPTITIDRASMRDVRGIKALIDRYAERQLMLPRPLPHLMAAIRDFFVARVDGELAGCVALHIDLEDLAEIRSLAVDERFKGLGLGRRLVETALADAQALQIERVYALTYIVEFFSRLGFETIDKSELPTKVWADCVNCPHFPSCNETAVIRRVGA